MTELDVFGDSLHIHEAYWCRQRMDRPLVGILPGWTAQDRFPATRAALPEGPLAPEDIPIDLFLADCDRLYQVHRQIGDDYPFTASPFIWIPWMEAITGCPVQVSNASIWAEPCVPNWDSWEWRAPDLGDPWPRKLLEMMEALVEHSEGRYPVSATMMRGPLDMLAAMRGAANLPLDIVDQPEVVAHALEACADTWIKLAKAQIKLIPESGCGYMDGDRGLRFWAPEKPIWLQEDAMSLLSPTIYREIVLPVDKRIAAEFPAVGFHLHGSALWAIDDLTAAPEIHIIELNLEAANTDVEGAFVGWKKIQEHKPVVIWRLYEDGFGLWLDRVLKEFPSDGLSIQVTVTDLDQARSVRSEIFDQIAHYYPGGA